MTAVRVAEEAAVVNAPVVVEVDQAMIKHTGIGIGPFEVNAVPAIALTSDSPYCAAVGVSVGDTGDVASLEVDTVARELLEFAVFDDETTVTEYAIPRLSGIVGRGRTRLPAGAIEVAQDRAVRTRCCRAFNCAIEGVVSVEDEAASGEIEPSCLAPRQHT